MDYRVVLLLKYSFDIILHGSQVGLKQLAKSYFLALRVPVDDSVLDDVDRVSVVLVMAINAALMHVYATGEKGLHIW